MIRTLTHSWRAAFWFAILRPLIGLIIGLLDSGSSVNKKFKNLNLENYNHEHATRRIFSGALRPRRLGCIAKSSRGRGSQPQQRILR